MRGKATGYGEESQILYEPETLNPGLNKLAVYILS